ncbi:F-box/FBD/LRR-repeat protein At1g13570-like isoform X2 [Rutidosis leptorrhynchoides]|uniref:F-box/FBD/LRR-repeat protein At1g13570-like isoform X2 n=1 Tax=Rutidosis leptorrhynchoides TaxID=125765 RepID=UPI003A99CE21
MKTPSIFQCEGSLVFQLCINHPPTFNGFGNLKTLCLEYVDIYKKSLMHILSNNPLKSFTMLTHGDSIMIFNDDEYGTMDDLFNSIPVIEHLTLDVWDCQYFGRGVIPREVATSLVHLKYLRLQGMCFLENQWFRFLLLMLRSSPNLEKLGLQMLCEHDDHEDLYSVTMQDCSDIWLEHLIEFEITSYLNKKHDLEFVKLILAKSPVLKKVRYYQDTGLKLLETLLSPPTCITNG